MPGLFRQPPAPLQRRPFIKPPDPPPQLCYHDEVIADSPSAVFPMDEASGNIVDLVAGLTGTTAGAPTYGATGPVTGDTAIDFAADADKFVVTDHANLDLGTTFSVECWIARDTDLGAVYATAIDKGTNAYQVGIDPGDDLFFAKSGVALAGLAGGGAPAAPVPSDGSWHHIVWTFTAGASPCHLYVDAVDFTASLVTNTDPTFADNASDLWIGDGPGDSHIGGKIAWVALYKTALSATRVAAHYAGATVACAGGGPINRTATDSLTYGESMGRLFVGFRATTDSTTRADVATRTVTLLRSVTDAVTRADVATRTGTFLRTITDAVARSDAATRTVTLLRSVTDAVTRSDAATRTVTLLRTVTDAVTYSDVAAAVKSIVRSATDSVTYADAATRTVTLLRTVTDAVTRADVATRTVTLLRTVTDSVTYSDVASQIKSIARQATDSVTYSDAATRTGTFLRSVTDAVARSDVATRTGTFLRTITDSVTWADVADQFKAGGSSVIRTATDAITYSDAATRTVTLLRTVTDAVTRSDAATRAVTLLRAAGDGTTYADVATRVKSAVRSATDSVTRSDVATRTGAFLRTVTDSTTYTDVVTIIGGQLVFIGGLPPVAAATRFLLRALGRSPTPDSGATGGPPQSDANHPKPGS